MLNYRQNKNKWLTNSDCDCSENEACGKMHGF
jgi:hypothetical protein